MAGDKPAFDLVLDEAMAEPTGVPGLLFTLVKFTNRLERQAYPDTFVADLHARIASRQLNREDHGGDGRESP